MLHTEQGHTSVTLRKRYKKTKTTHYRKGSGMLLYSVANIKTKERNPGRGRGQTWARHGHSLLGLENGPEEGKLI